MARAKLRGLHHPRYVLPEKKGRGRIIHLGDVVTIIATGKEAMVSSISWNPIESLAWIFLHFERQTFFESAQVFYADDLLFQRRSGL